MLGLPIRPRKFGSSVSLLANFFAYIWAGFFIFLIVLFLDSGFSGFVTGVRPFNLTEEFLIWSSFIPNDVGLTGSRRVCTNLEPGALISPFSTRDPMPKQVLLAHQISAVPDRLLHTYAYHVVECSRSANTGDSSSAKTATSPAQIPNNAPSGASSESRGY